MKAEAGPYGVILWSPSKSSSFHPVTNQLKVGASMSEVSGGFGPCVIGVSRRSIMVRTLRLPDTTRDQAQRMISVQLDTLFPLPAKELAWDFFFADDRNAEGRLAVVAAMRTDTLRDLLSEAKTAGLKVAAVLPAALASATLARQGGAAAAGVVQATPEGTAVEVVIDGALRSSRVSSSRDVDTATEVARSFAALNLPTGTVVEANEQEAAAALSHMAPTMNLELPEAVAARAKKVVDSRRGLALLLIVAAAGYGAVLYDDFSSKWAKDEKDRTKVEKQLAKLKEESDTLAASNKSLDTAQALADRTLKPKQRMADVLVVFSNLAPQGVWLSGVTLERGKLASIRGTATNRTALASFVSSLSKQSRFRDVQLLNANSGLIGQTNVVNFALSAHIVGNFPVTDAKRGSKK